MGDKQLGKKLKEAREKLKLTQKQVAEKSGVTTNWYARFERGEKSASLKTIKDIFKVLKLKVPSPFN
ncbi:MAG: helix-turn-helix transcriptional regulator [Candidatus Blackburnbacteria bacterium]|nr:helix-turn-helix transcriptional regulator [Candidatus Blackburnbacteria bacterium]